MAQYITKILVPITFYRWDNTVSPSGSIKLGVYTGKDPGVPVLVAESIPVNISSLPEITKLTYEAGMRWDKFGITQARRVTFVFSENIEITGKDYIVSLSFTGGDDNTFITFAGRLAIIKPFNWYNFNTEEWIDSIQVPQQYFSFYLYDDTVLIGQRWQDGVFYEGQYADTFSDPNYVFNHFGYHVVIETQARLPGKTHTPNPAHNGTNIDTSKTAFSWDLETFDTGKADYYEVYFDNGTGTLPDIPETVFTKDFLIGLTLLAEQSYKWRVDSVNEYGKTTGDVWTFTCETEEFYVPVLTQPTVWFSATGDYENFESGVKDADSFEIAIKSTNQIQWIESLESLLIGTASDEWKIGSNKLDTSLTPTNWNCRKQTTYGSRAIQAIAVNSVILFVDFVGRKIREMTISEDGQKYIAPDMTALAEHITESGIVCMAYQKNPDSILWCVLADGSLIGLVYDREQNVVAWFDCPMDGIVQSVCVTPGANEDEIWLSVKRTINETEVVYIEKMASRTLTSLADCFFVDCGITFTPGTPTSTITGLNHLIGETVKILGDGVVLDDAVVNGDGQVTAKLNTVATPVSKAQVGLPYRYTLQPMRIVLGGPEGTTLGSVTRVNKLTTSFLNSLGSKYGANIDNLFSVNFSDIRLEKTEYIAGLFSGDVELTMPGGHSAQNPILISDNDPLPCTVRAIVADVDVTG